MSVPVDHHFLPKFYLKRWTRAGRLYRFVRPRPDAALHQKRVAPGGVAYEPNLYAYSSAPSEKERQRLEAEYFQLIDDKAAVAFAKLDALMVGTGTDRGALVQFVLSLLHRSPVRIEYLRRELAERMAGVGDFDHSNREHLDLVRDSVNDLLTLLISSDTVVPFVSEMKAFKVEVRSRTPLVSSDTPLIQSDGIARPDGFLMLPYGPHRLLILAHDEKVALAFSTQDHETLAIGLNDAVIRQAQHVVIAASPDAKPFVEERFNPFEPIPTKDGLLRWKVP